MKALLTTDPRFERVKINTECPEELIIVADRDQFQQVFWNLFVNAAEAMPDGGKILVTAELLDGFRDKAWSGDVVRISVSDSGKGIPRNEVQKVFEPFYTTKTCGTGLGLATVYRIIESHAGLIQVDSAPEEGTVFTIFLPASRG